MTDQESAEKAGCIIVNGVPFTKTTVTPGPVTTEPPKEKPTP